MSLLSILYSLLIQGQTIFSQFDYFEAGLFAEKLN